MAFAAVGFALLYTETAVYSAHTAGTRGDVETAVVVALGFLLVLGGFLASLLVPARSGRLPRGPFKDASPVLNFFLGQFVMGAGLIGVTSLVALLLDVYLVWPNLAATSNLIKDLVIYAAVGIIYYQLVVGAIRYLNFLYRIRMDNATKVMVGESALAALTLILGLYLLTLDVVGLARTPDPTGVIGLHVTLRGLWAAVLVLVALGWQLRWVADH